ncbi:unnamed protein product [Victoria cruziana]
MLATGRGSRRSPKSTSLAVPYYSGALVLFPGRGSGEDNRQQRCPEGEGGRGFRGRSCIFAESGDNPAGRANRRRGNDKFLAFSPVFYEEESAFFCLAVGLLPMSPATRFPGGSSLGL